jgi:hypothetical protein
MKEVCYCDYFANEYRFMGMLLRFTCPVHGTVELDRKVAFVTMPTGTITSPLSPYVPYVPPCPSPNTTPWCPPSYPTYTCNGTLEARGPGC